MVETGTLLDTKHPSTSSEIQSVQKKREYKHGEVIVGNCEPFVKVVAFKYRKSICNNCFKSPELELVPCRMQCQQFYYCNNSCMENDWNLVHNKECELLCFRKYCHKGPNVDDKVLVFRMCILQKFKPDLADVQFLLHNNTSTCFNDLLSASESLEVGVGMEEECEAMAEILNREWSTSEMTAEYFQRLFGILMTHNFGVLNVQRTDWCGWGIYIQPAVLGYSCKPTAVIVNHGSTIQVRAIGPIPEEEEPCISYTEWSRDSKARLAAHIGPFRYECYCPTCKAGGYPLMDFRKINGMVNGMLKHSMSDVCSTTWIQIRETHNEVLSILRNVFHEYDERITGQLDRAFNIAMTLGMDMNLPEMQKLMAETGDHLSTTYGLEHSRYKAFQEMVMALERSLPGV